MRAPLGTRAARMLAACLGAVALLAGSGGAAHAISQGCAAVNGGALTDSESNTTLVTSVTATFAAGDVLSARRWFASSNLTGTWQWGPWRVAPRASIFYVEEEQTDIDGLTTGQTVRLGRVSLGPEIGYTIPLASERLRIELFGFAKSEYDFATDANVPLASGPFRHQRWGGRVGGGANIAWHPNFTARLQGSYNGLGQNGFDSWSGELRIGLRF